MYHFNLRMMAFAFIIVLALAGCEQPTNSAKPVTYKVSFDLNGGTIGGNTANPADQLIPSGGKVANPGNAAKAGHSFSGWFNGEAKWNFDGDTVTADITLKAGWTQNAPETYTVTFNGNAGSDAVTNLPAPITGVASGAAVDKPAPDPTRPGYGFGGWFTKNGEANDWGNEWNFAADIVTANITLYAKWTKNTPPPAVPVTDITGVPSGSAFTTMGVDLSGAEVQPPDATNKDIEWKVTSGPGVITGSKLTATSAGDVELTATIANGTAQGTAFIKTFTFQFKALDPNQRVVSFNAHGGAPAPEAQAVDVNGHAVKPADMKKTGYDFGGWFTKNGEANDWGNEWNFAADAVTDHIELYAKWTPASYQIAYHLDGGTNDAANPAGYTIESETITLKDPARNGYRFGGWYEKDDWSGSAVISIPKGSHGNKTFYARWIPSTGNINITFAGPEDEAITLGDNQTLSWAANDSLTITAPTGYASYQWLVDGMVDESVTGNEFAKDARDFTIKRHTVTVRVKTAGGRWYSKETTFTVSR